MLPSAVPPAAPAPLFANFIDDLLHPDRKQEEDDDPSRPFTPPPPGLSREEQEEDEDDGPSLPMNPALA